MNEPNSIDAERYVVGALLINPMAFWRIADRLRSADFSDARLARTFDAVAWLVRDKRDCDALTVAEECQSRGGGLTLPEIIGLSAEIPGAGNITGYAEIVASKAELRRLRAAGRQIAAMEQGTAADAAALIGQASRPAVHSVRDVRDVLREWYAELSARVERHGEMSGVPYGLGNLDDMTGGMQAGDLILLAARPSMGKTAFALQAARAAAGSGASVLVFTLEMSASQLMGRLMGSLARVSSDGMRNPADMDSSAWTRITHGVADIGALPIRFDESGSIGLDAMLAKIRQSHAVNPVRVVVIDYLQLITPPTAERNDLGLAAITRALKGIAKDLGCSVVLLSQLNRACEQRADKRPILSDLRDSGSIEQDADVVLMLYRDEYYNPQSYDKGCLEVLVRKHRNGATGMVPASADLRFGIFTGIDELPSANAPQESERVVVRGFGGRR